MTIAPPAKAWLKRSKGPNEILLRPRVKDKTAPNIVPIVAIPKIPVTQKTPLQLCWAAGYIKSGIKDSQGPKAKMMNKTQGVRLPLLWCKCKCSI